MIKNNFTYNPSRNSQPYTELNYAQNTSLHFDHFREIFLEVIYEYQPHELYTSNMPTSKLQLDSYGYANIKQRILVQPEVITKMVRLIVHKLLKVLITVFLQDEIKFELTKVERLH